MNKEDKKLLFKDLSARLLYGVIVKYKSREGEGDVQLGCGNIGYVLQLGNGWWKECKPYLRPIDDMTEEEEKEICQSMKDYNLLPGPDRAGVFCGEIVDWFSAHHFDYRGLIEKGLAIKVTEENNPYEEFNS